MFFDLIRKNSKRSRKENGIFFVSLIVAIVAFYIILSLENHDVILFLRTMESDAITKLLQLIPIFYGFTLFIIFFLIYFANKYQLSRRNHELGMYLMMGMKRSKLFSMLMAEDIWSSILSLFIGLPIAIVLSEIISLITARLVGLGIIGHHFSLSADAILFTVLGFFSIKFLANAILCFQMARKDIAHLLIDMQDEKQKSIQPKKSFVQFILGFLLLIIAYAFAIKGNAWMKPKSMGLTIILGICGTFFLFYGLAALFEIMFKNSKKSSGLHVFTFRQLQENVFLQSNSLAVSSLLLLLALCCFGFGISVSQVYSDNETHTMDFTFQGDEIALKTVLQKPELSKYIDKLFLMRVGFFDAYFNPEALLNEIRNLQDSQEKSTLMNNFKSFTSPYLISLSGYNQILNLKGEAPIQLTDSQVALYIGADFSNNILNKLLETALKNQPSIIIGDDAFQLTDQLYYDNLVTDRKINIYQGLIVNDTTFYKLVAEDAISSYWNAALNKDIVKADGLMQTIHQVDTILKNTNLDYESFLQNMGRQLFYMIASSYTTLYLGIIFFIVANTVISVQFLMQQQKTKKRYQTLISLGSDYASIKKSTRIHIKCFFGLPVIFGTIGGFWGVLSLFQGLLSSSMKSDNNMAYLVFTAAAIICILCIMEFIYIMAVIKLSDKQILESMQLARNE